MSGKGRTLDDDRNGALRRCLRLAQRPADTDRRPPLSDLADEFRVCVRTIRRDLLALQEAGWPVPPQWKDTGYYVQHKRHLKRGDARHPWRSAYKDDQTERAS